MGNKNDTKKFDPEKPYVIICEGADELYFMIAYLEHLKQKESEFQDCHYVIDLGGTDDVNKGIDNIKKYPHYEDMKSFLIIRDAEGDAVAAAASLQDHIKRTWEIELDDTGQIQLDNEGVKIGFFLLPGFNDNEHKRFRNGTLEDLCLDIIRDPSESISANSVLSEVDDHMCKIKRLYDSEMRHPHKNRLHLYLSSTNTFVGSKIGEAAQQGAFDFDNKRLADLREMILQMQD